MNIFISLLAGILIGSAICAGIIYRRQIGEIGSDVAFRIYRRWLWIRQTIFAIRTEYKKRKSARDKKRRDFEIMKLEGRQLRDTQRLKELRAQLPQNK